MNMKKKRIYIKKYGVKVKIFGFGFIILGKLFN